MMKEVLSVVLCVASSAAHAESTDSDARRRARDLQNQGAEYAKRGELRKALSLYAASQKMDPDYPFPHLGRGIVFTDLKNWKEALTEFDKALELKGDFHRALRGKAYVLYLTNRLDEALKSINAAIELKPGTADYLWIRAVIYAKSGQLDDGLNDANKAIELDAKIVDGYNARGSIYAAKNLRVEALADFSRVLELNPGNKYAAAARAKLIRPDLIAAGSRVTNSGNPSTSIPPFSKAGPPSVTATR